MDSSSSQQSENPEWLRNLASNVKLSGGNNLLHWCVLEDSHPNSSGSGHNMDDVLLSMSNVPANVVNALNDDGFSPLHLAVLKNNLAMVKKLLSFLVNIDIDARTRYSYSDMDYSELDKTALHLAAELGHLSIIRELLDKGAGIDIRNIDLQTALCRAVSLGHLDAMRLLVSKGADLNLGDGYVSPLFYAVQSKNLETVKFLVCSGAAVNFPDRRLNPLFYGIFSGSLDIIEFLVSNGADVDIKSDTRKLHHAVSSASFEFVDYLVTKGADVNIRDSEGETPLYYAISSGLLERVVFLLDHGADINARNDRHETPIHCAVSSINEEMHHFLTHSGVWRRHDVVRKSHLEIVRLLIDQGADLSAIDAEGRTPLHDAVYRQDSEMVTFLLDRGENLRAFDRWNPDYDADYRKFAKIIRVLLDRGADVDVENVDGETPLDFARNQLCMDALQDVR